MRVWNQQTTVCRPSPTTSVRWLQPRLSQSSYSSYRSYRGGFSLGRSAYASASRKRRRAAAKACGKMVCRQFNTGSGTHSKDPIPDSAEKPGQGRGICGGTMPRAGVGMNKSRLATIGDASGVAVRHKPGAATPFRNISIKIAEKCVSIFLEVQGDALPLGVAGARGAPLTNSVYLFFGASKTRSSRRMR